MNCSNLYLMKFTESREYDKIIHFFPINLLPWSFLLAGYMPKRWKKLKKYRCYKECDAKKRKKPWYSILGDRVEYINGHKYSDIIYCPY